MPRTRSIIDYLMCACDGGRAMAHVWNVQYEPHYAGSGCDQELSLPVSASLCPRPCPAPLWCLEYILGGQTWPGARQEFSNFIISLKIFVADWKIAMNNFTNNTLMGQSGESEQDKSNFRFIRQ